MRRWNARQMVLYVLRELDYRFVHTRKNNDLMNKARRKPIIDLALENYLAEDWRRGRNRRDLQERGNLSDKDVSLRRP